MTAVGVQGASLINILQFQVNLLRGQKGCLVHYKNNEHSQHSTAAVILITVSSSAERGIMCDKILGPDTLNVDMGDFVWNNTASCKCRIWNKVQLISVCCPSLHFWLVPNKIFWSWNWGAPIWWAVWRKSVTAAVCWQWAGCNYIGPTQTRPAFYWLQLHMRRCDILTEFRVCCSSVRMKQLQFLLSNNRGPEVFWGIMTLIIICHQNDNDHHHHWDETLRTVEFACESIRFYISTYREQFTLVEWIDEIRLGASSTDRSEML